MKAIDCNRIIMPVEMIGVSIKGNAPEDSQWKKLPTGNIARVKVQIIGVDAQLENREFFKINKIRRTQPKTFTKKDVNGQMNEGKYYEE